MSPRLQPCPHPLCTRSHNRNCSRTERLYFLAAPVDQPDPSLRWIPLVRPHPPDQPVLSLPLFLPRPSFLADQPVRPRLSFPPPLWFLADQLVRPLLADPPARSARSPRSPRSHQPLPRPLSLLEDQSAPWFPPRPSLLPGQPPLSSPAVQPRLWPRLLPSLLLDQSARPRLAVQSLRPPPRFPSLPPDQSVRRCLAVRLPLSLPSFLEDRLVPSLLVVLAIPPGSDSCSHCPTLRACRWQSRVCIGPLPALARVGQGQPK